MSRVSQEERNDAYVHSKRPRTVANLLWKSSLGLESFLRTEIVLMNAADLRRILQTILVIHCLFYSTHRDVLSFIAASDSLSDFSKGLHLPHKFSIRSLNAFL
jgi:hypothetical protein